jgi:hypothetical protein
LLNRPIARARSTGQAEANLTRATRARLHLAEPRRTNRAAYVAAIVVGAASCTQRFQENCNGSRNYDPKFEPVTDNCWRWVHDDEYLVAMCPLPDYRELRTFAVNSWLPQSDDAIVVLQRVD